MVTKRKSRADGSASVTLKAVAQHVGLSPGTVSAVLNNAPSSHAIPAPTKERIFAAARELNYRPNFFARSLRRKRTYTIGVIAEEIGDAYSSGVISGIESCLRRNNYFFLTVIHRHDPELLRQYADLLIERGVEGIIAVDLQMTAPPPLPTVVVAGHRELEGVTNIVLDHDHGISQAIEHLVQLGHRRIAYIKGNLISSDAEDRWAAIGRATEKFGLQIDPDLVAQIDIEEPTPQMGYPYTKQLLARNIPFTAVFAYNDLAAIGAVRALQESGLRVPEDVSVVGFDDIQTAAFFTPSLTTVRQPLGKMGQIAADTLIKRIEGNEEFPSSIAIEPSLVVRESTGPARTTS